MAIRNTLFGFAVLVAVATPAAAEDYMAMSCPELWRAENAMLKRHGWCFTEKKAIETFSNAGCSVRMESRLGLSDREREDRARMVLAQRVKLCKRGG